MTASASAATIKSHREVIKASHHVDHMAMGLSQIHSHEDQDVHIVSEVEVCPFQSDSQRPRGHSGRSRADNSSRGNGRGREQRADTVNDFAQISATSSNHSCQTATDRAKADLVDFYGIYDGTSPYSDEDFTPDDSALFWSDMSEGPFQNSYDIHWTRASTQFSDHTLFGSGGITARDINQGFIGNCWFLSSCSAIAEVPGRMESIFSNQENVLSSNGIYAVNFYALGVPHTVIVDDWLPLRTWGNGYNTLFAHISDDSGLWGPIIEKAFAKFQGNYRHIISGNPMESTRKLIGSPSVTIDHNNVIEDELWNTIVENDSVDNMIQAGSPGSSDSQTDDKGLVQNHAYVVLSHVTLDGVKLVKLRNPWGQDSWQGDWGHNSPLWTDDLRERAGENVADTEDGVIFMTIADYKSRFVETYISKDTTGWGYAKFLKLDDDTTPNGIYDDWCGATCIHHTLTLTSEVDQLVYLSANVWDRRIMPNSCESLTSTQEHSFQFNGSNSITTWRYGDLQLQPFDMTAGESVTIDLEFDFTNPDISKDWSLVAWGEQGGLTITHESQTSDEFAVLDARESTEGGSSGDGSTTPEEETTTPEEETTTPEEETTTPEEETTTPEEETTTPEEETTTPEEETTTPEEETSPTPPVVVVDTAKLDAFNAWVDAETVPGLPAGYCGSYFNQDVLYNDDGTWQIRVAMTFQCHLDWVIREYTVTFDNAAYQAMEFFYETYDEAGNIVNTTVETCDEPVGDKITCYYELGYQPDYASLGLTEGWQLKAGFQFDTYTNVALDISGRWVF